jgi:predicted heme/steroid binding protein
MWRVFTRKDLEQFNGKNGAPAYIAFNGEVYDVTKSFLWLGGRHQVLHSAGTDLTGQLREAPHSEEVLRKFPVVGLLLQDEPES